ncbi:MAG: hypothetical protein ABEH65_07790 [Halobacteriales archaeon]
MSIIARLRRIGGAVLLLKGLFGLLFPRQFITLNLRLLFPGFENPGDLEPKSWYVETIRAVAAGMIATGIVSLIQSDGHQSASTVDPIQVPTDDGADENGENGSTADSPA